MYKNLIKMQFLFSFSFFFFFVVYLLPIIHWMHWIIQINLQKLDGSVIDSLEDLWACRENYTRVKVNTNVKWLNMPVIDENGDEQWINWGLQNNFVVLLIFYTICACCISPHQILVWRELLAWTAFSWCLLMFYI